MTARRRVDSVQAMRAAAALLVVIFHSGREAAKRAGADPSPLLAFTETADFGVDIFFVISGFIMYYVTHGRPAGAAAARDFLLKRMVRVVPMYWLFTTLFIAPLLLAPALLNRTGYSVPYLISSYLFVPWQRPGGEIPNITPIFGVGWTLNYEMMFYAVFAGLIAAGVRSRLAWLAILFGALTIVGFVSGYDNALLFFWSRSQLLQFVAGAGIAALFCRDKSLPTGAAIALVLAGVVGWQATAVGLPVHKPVADLRGIFWGLPAAAMMAGVVLNQRVGALISSPLTQRIGNASFSLYLSHLFVIRATSVILGKLHLLGAPLVLIVVNIVAASIVAILVYRFVETPLERFFAGLIWRDRKPPQILAPDK